MSEKITIIEDDQVLARVLQDELEEAGFSVSVIEDGEIALTGIENERPDLVLLDLLLPNKHGFVILEEMKKSAVLRNIPVIILSMLGSDDDIKKGLQLGANDYFVKSQHPVAEIVEKVKNFLAREASPRA
ncbi:MAG: response regulator [Parcubacteria group bacterium]|nr:response regulator [Parcubacteria group bacterium]